ncbi:MAG: hypothetical protein QF662_07295, partial [Phycisphaerae bacterium]|nr:hypothetical protein [Phycisphaerae bacterium]
MTLMQAYLKRKGDSVSPTNQVDMAKTYAALAAKTGDGAQKEKLFDKSQSFYLSAIKSADKQVDAIKELTSKTRSKLRMDLLQWKLELADMIFEKWASPQLNLMEITDRQQGDREKVIKMVGTSLKHYRETLQDLNQWISEMDRSADFDEAFDNPEFYRDALRLQRRSRYTMAWVTYYYAYVLPDNFKPADGQRSRGVLLETALTLIMEHATIANDSLVRKWEASLLVGL